MIQEIESFWKGKYAEINGCKSICIMIELEDSIEKINQFFSQAHWTRFPGVRFQFLFFSSIMPSEVTRDFLLALKKNHPDMIDFFCDQSLIGDSIFEKIKKNVNTDWIFVSYLNGNFSGPYLNLFSEKHRTKSINDKYFLHLGCGKNYKQEFINMDNNSDNNISILDVFWDISSSIPVLPNSVDVIYHEHFIEHLSYENGLHFLKECHRALKKEGVMRIACPDLDEDIAIYLNNKWHEQEWVKGTIYESTGTRCMMLNMGMNIHPWGHQYVYNEEDLVSRLLQAGFHRSFVKRESFLTSEHTFLANIDSRNSGMFFDIIKQ